MADKEQDFFNAWGRAKQVAVLTGAGVSTLSGIPDFRGKNGFYSGDPRWNGYLKEELFEINFFHRHPEVFYQFAREYLYPMLKREPSIIHTALAKLQSAGKIGKIYTQNIDALHTRAGANEVGELHGTLRRLKCINCHASVDIEVWLDRIVSGEIPLCGCGGILKPEVVFFGENLDEELLEEAFDTCGRADMIWVLGSSLTVQPAASLPVMTYRHGGKIVIVNADPTPMDNVADFRFFDLQSFGEAISG